MLSGFPIELIGRNGENKCMIERASERSKKKPFESWLCVVTRLLDQRFTDVFLSPLLDSGIDIVKQMCVKHCLKLRDPARPVSLQPIFQWYAELQRASRWHYSPLQ